TCYFSEQPGHCTHKCNTFQQAKQHARANKGKPRRHRNANKASETPTSSSATPTASTSSTSAPTVPQSAQSVTEFAGNASLRSFDFSHPLCPLQLDAHADWNADTG